MAVTSNGDTEVVLTGLGMTSPLGGDVESSWQALLDGESGAAVLTDDWAADMPVRIAARLRREPKEVLEPVHLRRLDRFQQLALIAAREAWADAGRPDVPGERLAVVMGTGLGGGVSLLHHDEVRRTRGPMSLTPFAVPMIMANGAAAAVSLDLGAKAGAHTPVSSCASGAEAFVLGAALLRAGMADVVVAGGSDAFVNPMGISSFARLGSLSKREDAPQDALRPFDSARDGFVLAEGGAAVVMERRADARARGARCHAVLAGTGVTSDAVTMTSPDVDGQMRAIRLALAAAGLGSSDIAHINAHATGTPVGDASEAAALTAAIGLHPLVTATKSATGHMIGGTGAVEAVFTALAVREGVVPPTRNLDDQDPKIKLDVVTGEPYRTALPAALSNAFGFGGHNVVLVFTAA